MIGDVLAMIFPIIGAACVIILTYYVSKWYARRMGPLASGSHIKIIDRQMVSKSGSLLIVEIDGSQYVVGATEQMVQIMLKLDQPIPYEPPQPLQAKNLKELFQLITKKDGGHGQNL